MNEEKPYDFYRRQEERNKEILKFNDLRNRFTYHPPKNNQSSRYKELRSMAYNFAMKIEELCPDSREKSLALTNLEQAIMWANASIARNE